MFLEQAPLSIERYRKVHAKVNLDVSLAQIAVSYRGE